MSGYAVGRSRHYWVWTITGYALTVLSVPLIGATGALAPALLLYGTERLGKAVRSPAKDTLLSFAAAGTGRGSAFGVHQALDQTGAIAGPLLLAALLGRRSGDYRLAFGALIVPGLLVLALLAWLRRRVPDPRDYEMAADREQAIPGGAPLPGVRGALPARYWQYVALVGLLSCGVASFPLLAFHAQSAGLLSEPVIPVVFALAMAVDGVAGLLVGRLYDRRGPRVLLAVPVAAAGSAVAFTASPLLLWVGIAVWGVVNGVLDSTLKAVVTELVPRDRRAVGFGWLALTRGAALLVAGGVLGVAYDISPHLVITVVITVNAVALVGLARLLPGRTTRRTQPQHTASR